MTDLKKLRELAEVATPGPWEVSGTGQQVLKEADVPYGDQRICETNSMASHYPGKTSCWKNIAFIAAANPETVIALIDRIEKLELQLKEASEVAQFYAHPLNWDMEHVPTEVHRVIENSDLSVPDEHCDQRGGKRARAYLKKWKGEK